MSQATLDSTRVRSAGTLDLKLHHNQMAIQWRPVDNETYHGVYVVYTPTPAKDPLCLYDVVCGNSETDILPIESTTDATTPLVPGIEGYDATYKYEITLYSLSFQYLTVY